jgi:hypothetical protein
MSLCVQILVTVYFPPCTTFTTPSGTPDYFNRSMSMLVAPATFSDGLRMYVLPRVIAKGNIHRGTIAGKLNGAIPAQTPKGTR